MPILDIDDLGFFRALGLGLRHVEREQGIKESREGGKRGDAVSLANYGQNPEEEYPPLSMETCINFQIEVERFILSSYLNYHLPKLGYSESNSSYYDAAFLLVARGDDARHPYDFLSYPLGKCGTKAFSANQVILLVTSEQYQSEDAYHAALNTFIDIKNRTRQLKIQRAQQLLDALSIQQPAITTEQLERLKTILKTMISHYQHHVFIESDIFLKLFNITSKWPTTDEMDEVLKTIEKEVSNIVPHVIKTDLPMFIKHEMVDFDELSIPDLKLKLLHYISHQNLTRVKDCLIRLPKNAFTNTEHSPLQHAAMRPNTEILRAVYNAFPEQYDLLMSNPSAASPIYFAGHYREQGNLEFLLGLRKLSERDIRPFDEHIMSAAAFNASEKSYHLIHYLIQHGAHIGNNVVDFNKNPMALCVIYGNDWSQKILELMLPLADYHSKYLGILSATNELYFSYGHGKRPMTDHTLSDRVKRLQHIRNMILCSLTPSECEKVRELFLTNAYDQVNGKKILMNELFNHELKKLEAENKTQPAENIKRCFKPTLSHVKSKQQPVEPKGTTVYSQIVHLQKPPHDLLKPKIQMILTTLKENILQKNGGRALWFSPGTDHKVSELTRIETWLAGHSVNKENESTLLREIEKVCAIKRNKLGFFKPHSLIEYQRLLEIHRITR